MGRHDERDPRTRPPAPLPRTQREPGVGWGRGGKVPYTGDRPPTRSCLGPPMSQLVSKQETVRGFRGSVPGTEHKGQIFLNNICIYIYLFLKVLFVHLF